MAIVKAFKISGIYCCFYSNDHEPPHFHAMRKGAWHYRVYFLKSIDEMLEAKRGRITGADRRKLISATTSHRWDLLEEWNAAREG